MKTELKNDFSHQTETKKEAKVMATKVVRVEENLIKKYPILDKYYRFFEIDNYGCRGTNLTKYLPGETRTIPIKSIAISMNMVETLAKDGYYLKDLSKDVYSKTITKDTVEGYFKKLQFLINNGRLIKN